MVTLRRQHGPIPDPGFIGVLLLLIPGSHLWAIGRYRLLDLNLRLRRHVQYSFVSTFWALVPLVLLAWLLLLLPRLELSIPDVRIRGSSLEVLQGPLASPDREAAEKLLLMVVAIALAFGLRRIARRGHQWISSRFYRAEHDYRLGAREMARLVTARPDLEGLAVGLVDAVVKLLQVKRAGALFFHQERAYCMAPAHGFELDEWQRVSSALDDLREGVRKAHDEVAAEYTSRG